MVEDYLKLCRYISNFDSTFVIWEENIKVKSIRLYRSSSTTHMINEPCTGWSCLIRHIQRVTDIQKGLSPPHLHFNPLQPPHAPVDWVALRAQQTSLVWDNCTWSAAFDNWQTFGWHLPLQHLCFIPSQSLHALIGLSSTVHMIGEPHIRVDDPTRSDVLMYF